MIIMKPKPLILIPLILMNNQNKKDYIIQDYFKYVKKEDKFYQSLNHIRNLQKEKESKNN